MIKNLERREQCNTYLTHVCRHRCSVENPLKLSANTVAFISCRSRMTSVFCLFVAGRKILGSSCWTLVVCGWIHHADCDDKWYYVPSQPHIHVLCAWDICNSDLCRYCSRNSTSKYTVVWCWAGTMLLCISYFGTYLSTWSVYHLNKVEHNL